MKKTILIFSILLCSMWVFSQDRTVTSTMDLGATYYNYEGTAADTLGPVDQDTLDLVFVYRADGFVKKLAVKTRFDLNSLNDTVVDVFVDGKEFEDDATWTSVIDSTRTDDINADNTVQILTSDWTETFGSYNTTIASHAITYPADTFFTTTTDRSDTLYRDERSVTVAEQTLANAAQTVTPFDKSYRYYRVRYVIVSTASALGTGVKIDDVELKFYTE